MDLRDWLTQTTAGSVMLPRVITVNANDLLAEAAEVLIGEQISGAPVVNEAGMCVGVISVNDLAQADATVADDTAKIAESLFWSSNLILPVTAHEEKLAQVKDRLLPAADQPVHRFMTKELVSVCEEDSLEKVLRAILEAHVHRVVVLDENQQLRGVVSTTDVLAAMLYASEEG